jgi:hypothetical protein
VLLGDTVELRQGPLRDALAEASRVLRTVAEALGEGREVVLVPGNHDHHLLSGWLQRRADQAAPGTRATLGLDDEVDWRPGEALAALAGALGAGGATVHARYPGIWLRDDVYATHGHYIDRHTTVPMFERLAAGVMSRTLRRPLSAAHTPEDYEAVLAPIYAWIHAVAQHGGPEVGRSSHGASARLWQAIGRRRRASGLRGTVHRRATSAGVWAAIAGLNRAGVGPLSTELSPPALRRAGLRAFGEMLAALGIGAEYAIFGHTHRAGPLPADDAGEWRAPTGAHMLNSGCWVHEPAFLGREPATSPYRAGFCVRLDDEGPPRLENLIC